MEKSTSRQQFPIFSAELSRMKRSIELLSKVTRTIHFKAASSSAMYKFEWFSQQPILTFPHDISMFCDAQVKIYSRIDRNPFPSFSNLQLVRASVEFRYESLFRNLLYI